MASQKISQLPAYTTPAPTDVLPIVDLNTDLNKKVTISDLITSANLDSRYVQKSSNGSVISPFVSAVDGSFVLHGEDFRYASFNYYPLLTLSKTATQSILDALQRRGCTVIRSWLFPDHYQSLFYTVGTNLLTNTSFETDLSSWTVNSSDGFAWVRSNDTAEVGSYSAKMDAGSGFTQLGQQVTVTANTNYAVTFWHNTTNRGGAGPVAYVGTVIGQNDIHDSGFIGDTGGIWAQQQMLFNSGANTSVWLTFQNFNGSNLHYIDNVSLATYSGTPTLIPNEIALRNYDMVLDEAGKRGIKIMFSLADNNNAGNTRSVVVNWANAIYGAALSTGFPYIGFFQSDFCRTIYKNSFDVIANRVNTINGLVAKDNPAIFSWEMGNELRIDVFDSESGTQNTANSTNVALMADWITDVGTHMHATDPNHMVAFGDMAHTWNYYATPGGDEDLISNGSGYGVDYNIFAALDVLNYCDVHIYPNQNNPSGFGYGNGGGAVKGFGYRLGFLPISHNNPSAAGFRGQLADWVNVFHAHGKPAVITETGLAVEDTPSGDYPLYPRYQYYSNLMNDWYGYGGNGLNIWHAVNAKVSGGSFDVALNAWGGEAVTDNTDDTNTMNFIQAQNARFHGPLLDAQVVSEAQYVTYPTSQALATSGTISINPFMGALITQTPTGDSTFNMASVGSIGHTLTFQITTSGTTPYALTFGTSFVSTGILRTGTTSGKVFLLSFVSNGTTYNEVARSPITPITSAAANALTVGPNGLTNPALNVDASTASSATGLNVKSAAASAGLALAVTSSATNESLTLAAKGTGTVTVNPGVAIASGGAVAAGIQLSSTANFGVYVGTGAPTFAAAQGSLYLNNAGSSTSTRLYVNSSGSTTWVAVTTAS